MTFRVLDQIATQLARQLVSVGVKSGDFVPLCFEKSTWAVVSMPAILKPLALPLCR